MVRSSHRNLGGGGGSVDLAGLTDVTLTSPATDETLAYETSTEKWVNKNTIVIPAAPDPLDLMRRNAAGNAYEWAPGVFLDQNNTFTNFTSFTFLSIPPVFLNHQTLLVNDMVPTQRNTADALSLTAIDDFGPSQEYYIKGSGGVVNNKIGEVGVVRRDSSDTKGRFMVELDTTPVAAFQVDPEGGIEMPEISTPSATPASGRRKIYPKSTGWFQKNSGGVESELGSGGGAVGLFDGHRGKQPLAGITSQQRRGVFRQRQKGIKPVAETHGI